MHDRYFSKYIRNLQAKRRIRKIPKNGTADRGQPTSLTKLSKNESRELIWVQKHLVLLVVF